MERNVEVRSQKSEERIRAATVRERLQPLAPARGSERRRAGMPVLLLLLTLVFSPCLRAQFDSGSTGALGNFINPLTVVSASDETCNYVELRMDLAQGKAFAIPYRSGSNVDCNRALVDITATVFANPPTAGFLNGVIDVTNFTLQDSFLTGADNSIATYLSFVPNPNNTPVIIRATGNVTFNGGTFITVEGSPGVRAFGLVAGQGGQGGPGGYRGGEGGDGGIAPTKGGDGLGPGGGVGGLINQNSLTGAKFLTTGVTIGTTAIPAGNDLLSTFRGGSGGGGGGGRTNLEAGGGGGGGGGAVLIAANGTITVSGTVTANGGGNENICCNPRTAGTPGTGGIVRLVAATIAGGGNLTATSGGNICRETLTGCPPGSASGIVRLEAITISYTGGSAGIVQAASVPGSVVVAAASGPAFIKFTKLTDSNNAGNTITVDTAIQITPGRTGSFNPVDVKMPNAAGFPASSVKVDFEAGPNPGFPTGKTITLVVTPVDAAGGGAQSYTGTVTCPVAPALCTASITGVVLPVGASSLSAFTVVNFNADGTISQMFPRMYQGEPIEQVRIQTSGKETEYVLIARSGKEFPYKPGSDAGR